MIRALIIMNPVSLSLGLMCVLNIWTIGYAAGCGARQAEVNGRCCDLCPPGEYMKEFCSEHSQTVCSPCEEGYFSNQYTIFDRCEKCQSCQQQYGEKCTLTTNANCSCWYGFLCTNNLCSACEENKCVTGEKPKRTDSSLGKGMIEYSYQCEPACPDNAYYDVKADVCKPRAQCSLFGLAEQSPGNKTHNSVCDGDERYRNNGARDIDHMILGIGFVLLSLTIIVLLSHTFVKHLTKHEPSGSPTNIPTVSVKASDFQLSQEESGLELIIQDESKNSVNLVQYDWEKVSIF